MQYLMEFISDPVILDKESFDNESFYLSSDRFLLDSHSKK